MTRRSIFDETMRKLETENNEFRELFSFTMRLLIEERDPKVILSILEERLEELKQTRLRW